MKLIKIILFFAIVLVTFNVSAQKVKMKKGKINIDGLEWATYEKPSFNKYFFSTLDGEEFLVIDLESFGTGEYNNGNEKKQHYFILKFINNEEISEPFEIEEVFIKRFVVTLYNSKVLVDGKVSVENVLNMKVKYAEDISGRRY